MNKASRILIQLKSIIRTMLKRRRFADVSFPDSFQRKIYDRETGECFALLTRDMDDWIQVETIFLQEEFNLEKTGRQQRIESLYAAIKAAGTCPLILDIGANIGLASRYFNIVYPGCTIISVEPDPGNAAIAAKNLTFNCKLLTAAVSANSGIGDLITTGRNVGFRVSHSVAGIGDVKLIPIDQLLKGISGSAPFLIKIDIEGFESDLFSANTDWIDLFPIMLVELHDWMLPGQQVTKNLLKELSKRDRDFMHFDGFVASIASDLSKFSVL